MTQPIFARFAAPKAGVMTQARVSGAGVIPWMRCTVRSPCLWFRVRMPASSRFGILHRFKPVPLPFPLVKQHKIRANPHLTIVFHYQRRGAARRIFQAESRINAASPA